MPKAIDIKGKTFGRLTAVELTSRIIGGKPIRYWKCTCACGSSVTVKQLNLRCGTSQSCGCLQRELCGKNRILASGEGFTSYLIASYRNRSKKKQVKFLLTRQDFRDLLAENCVYCGAPPSNGEKYKDMRYPRRRGELVGAKVFNGTFLYNGIDRKDSTVGYVKENCVTCCAACNTAKSTMTVSDFRSWVTRVHNHIRMWP